MKIKRFIAAISLAALSGVCVLGNLVGANAEEFPSYSIEDSEAIQDEVSALSTQSIQKDPNGDGVLDLADAVYIARFLAGNLYPTDVSRLDYSGNGIVSQLDTAMVAKTILQGMNN